LYWMYLMAGMVGLQHTTTAHYQEQEGKRKIISKQRRSNTATKMVREEQISRQRAKKKETPGTVKKAAARGTMPMPILLKL